MAKKPKKVEVKWVDSAGAVGVWHPHDTTVEPLTCWSSGYLVDKDARKVVLAQSWGKYQHGHLLSIPREAVKSIRKVS